jgi:hypothetical protein
MDEAHLLLSQLLLQSSDFFKAQFGGKRNLFFR